MEHRFINQLENVDYDYIYPQIFSYIYLMVQARSLLKKSGALVLLIKQPTCGLI